MFSTTGLILNNKRKIYKNILAEQCYKPPVIYLALGELLLLLKSTIDRLYSTATARHGGGITCAAAGYSGLIDAWMQTIASCWSSSTLYRMILGY